jgi:hypothetical protein
MRRRVRPLLPDSELEGKTIIEDLWQYCGYIQVDVSILQDSFFIPSMKL